MSAPKGPCSIEGCEAPAMSRTWCSTHYWRWWRHGDPLHSPKIPHCGTHSAYKRHIRLGEETDAECREAMRTYTRELRERSSDAEKAERRAQGAAWSRARTRLTQEYPERYREIYAEELGS